MASADMPAPRSARAKALVDYLIEAADCPYGRLEAVTHEVGVDIVDVIVEPELVQRRKVPILNEEPIRLVFKIDDDKPPRIYARRGDFPSHLVHTNLERSGHGCHLCVWEENWNDLRRALTAQVLFERIRSWLSKTADGTLHQPEQALEPMIPVTSSTVILPAGSPPAALYVSSLRNSGKGWALCLDSQPPDNGPLVQMSIFNLVLPPQVHGALRNYPMTLAELRDLIAQMGVDLVQALGDWTVEPEQLVGADRNVLLIITLPKKASARAKVREWDVWGLQPIDKLFALGERLGRTAPDPGTGQPRRLIPADACGPIDAVDLIGWRVVHRLDRSAARAYSATTLKKDVPLVGIGAGAIGSNLMANAVRAGIGPWTVIDDDMNLPHNIVRQFQLDPMAGQPKAQSASGLFDAILAEGGNQGINANFLDAEDTQATRIGEALKDAVMAIDFSASPAVLGALAEDTRVSRAASFFFSPDARDLVILCEDKARKLRLDEIEAQYFIAAGTSSLLKDHLDGSRTDFVRYANACQDLTRPVPPWQVQTLCGVGAGQLLGLLSEQRATAGIWHLDSTSAGILPMRIPLSGVHRQAFSRFRISVSAEVVGRMRALRLKNAPNETGGILLGSFDLARNVVHVVDALPAPPDSRQTPTYFVRGTKQLKPIVDGIGRRSAGTITYLGEWHSHPDGAEVGPSDDDEGVFAYLKEHLDVSGAPYLMVICGKKEVWLRAGWRGGDPAEATIVHE